MASGSSKREPDYYGSLERLPLAPVRGKPPPYASRRKQDSRRGNPLKGNRELSSSVGDLATPTSRSKTNPSTRNGGVDDLGIPLDPRDASHAPSATPAHPHHQRHGSVSYSFSEHNPRDASPAPMATPVHSHHQRHDSVSHSFLEHSSSRSGDNSVPWHPREMSGVPSATPTHSHHHQHGSVSYSCLEHSSKDSEVKHKRGSDSNPSQEGITPAAMPTPQPLHQWQGSVSYSLSGNTSKSNTNTSNTSQEQRPKGREQGITQGKTEQKQQQGGRNTANSNKTTQERFQTQGGETSASDTDSPASTLERRQRSGSTSKTNSLKNYRELAAIPNHALVKWSRSKSMNDVFTGDDGKNYSDQEENKGEMRRTASYSDTKDAVDKEERDQEKMRLREIFTDAKDAEKRERNKGEMRHTARYSNTKDAVDERGRSKDEPIYRARPISVRSRNENKVPNDTGKEGRSKDEGEHRASKGENRVANDSVDKERGIKEVKHIGRPSLVRSRSGDEVNDVEKTKMTTQGNVHSPTSSSSVSPPFSSRQKTQEDARGGSQSDGDGVFVATPVFLEGSPSPSPPFLQPSSSSAHPGSHVQGAEQDLLTREKDSAALSTLRREILHLTRLKEEIELNLIKSQTELKEQVAGLRQERGGLEAVMEEREKRLHAQEEEIKDLKDTIAQLQSLIFASDGEARLQRQASDLQEQLREEKRHRMEETTQLRRELRALTSRLKEKDEQLEKYKSDPALNSWDSGRLEKGTTGNWKTSLPDVRKELVSMSLGGSTVERRRSFSSTSDCSDDGRSSTASSFIFRASKGKSDVSDRPGWSAVRSSDPAESTRKPSVAPVSDLRPSTEVVTTEKFDRAPVGEERARGAFVRAGKAGESSGKPRIAPVNDSRFNRAPARARTALVPSGETDKVLVGEARLWRAPNRVDEALDVSRKSDIPPVSNYRFNGAMVPSGETVLPPAEEARLKRAPLRPDKAAEVSRNLNIGNTDDSSQHCVPIRLETPLQPRSSARKPTNEARTDTTHGKSNVATLDLAPGLLTTPLGDAEESQRNQTTNGGRTRVKTTVYLELGDYTRSGGGGEEGRLRERDSGRLGDGEEEGYSTGLREGDHGRRGVGREDHESSGGHDGGLREGEYGRLRNGEREYGRSGLYGRGYRENDYGRPVTQREGDYTMVGAYDRRPREGKAEEYGSSLGHNIGYRAQYRVEGCREGDDTYSVEHNRKPRGGNYGRYEGGRQRGHAGGGGMTSHALYQTPTAPPGHYNHHQLSTAPPPPPHDITREVTTMHHDPPPSQQVTRSSAKPVFITREGQVTRQEPSAQIRPQGMHAVRSSGGMETSMDSSWMYKQVDGTRGAPGERWRRDSQVSREVENRNWNKSEVQKGGEYERRRGDREVQRETEYGRRGVEYGRGGEHQLEGGMKNRRTEDVELPRGIECGTRNPGTHRGAENWQRKDTDLISGNMRLSTTGESRTRMQATSYISASIHCLYNIAPLRHFFTEELRGLGVRSEVAEGVSGMFAALESGTGDERALQRLQEAVGHRDKIFLLHQDPPAVDFLSCLLAWLHSDLTPQTHPQTPSVISQLFHGLRESQITCPTKGEVLSTAMESFNYLTLSVPGEGAWTLQELLTRRFESQEMNWMCQFCGCQHPCMHQLSLLQPPRVLLVYLRRPSSGAAAARVLFPESGLVLRPHQLHEARVLRSPKYELVGMVTREMGDDSSISHHSAFCRRIQEGGSWKVWREQRVAAVSRREVLSQQASHVLFYIQQEE